MKSRKAGNTFIILIERGEQVIESLTKFCKDNNVKCGHFIGLGALDKVELAHYIVDNKEYSSQKFEGPMEITNLTGNITEMDGEVYIHTHITCGKQDMSLIGGHFKEGRVHAVLEIFLTQVEAQVNRKHDEKIGLNVMEL